MAGLIESGLSTVVVKEGALQEIWDNVFKYSDLFGLLPDLGTFGGSSYDVPILYDDNSSAQVYVENQAVPDEGYQATVTASFSYKSFRVLTKITGHARRAAGALWDSSDAPSLYGGQLLEEQKAIEDLLSLWNLTFIGASKAAHNLVGIIDDATTAYGGLSRTTYAALASNVVAGGSAAVTAALLDNLLTTTYDATKGGQIELILASPTQCRKISAITQGKLALDTSRDQGASGGAYNPGLWAGVPIRPIRGMLNSVILGLSDIDRAWGWANHERAGIDVLPYGVTSDAKSTQYSMSGCVVCTLPSYQGVIESLGVT